MPRTARIVIPNVAHHVTHRGNNRSDIFHTDRDREAYLALLTKYTKEYHVTLLGYCLMSNHIHLIIIPPHEASLSQVIGHTHLRYAQLFNHWYNQEGHLWQGRFFSCAMDDAHAVNAMCYIERNPVRAGLVQYAWEYPWSSAAEHVKCRRKTGFIDLQSWFDQWSAQTWQEMLRKTDDNEQITAIRKQTKTGIPLGSNEFLDKVEEFTGKAFHRNKL